MKKERSKNNKLTLSAWSGAGFAIGFACGYVSLNSWVSGVILGIGLALALGIAGQNYPKKSK
jgi:hypothetical protein